jgi:hypothetical protein
MIWKRNNISDPKISDRKISDRKIKKAPDVAIRRFLNFGGTCGGRTHDKRIKSPLLYQLS